MIAGYQRCIAVSRRHSHGYCRRLSDTSRLLRTPGCRKPSDAAKAPIERFPAGRGEITPGMIRYQRRISEVSRMDGKRSLILKPNAEFNLVI